MRICVNLSAVLLLALTGCERSNNGQVQIAVPQTNQVVKESSSPVVVRIDGVEITKDKVLRDAKAILTLNMNKQRKTALTQREWNYFKTYCANGVEREKSRAAIRLYLRENKIAIPSNVMQRITKSFEKAYGAKSKKLKRWHRIDDLKFMLGKNAAFIDEELQHRANFLVATNAIITKAALAASPDEISKRIQDINAFNERAAATNAFVFARATNVWHEVMANTNQFESIAQKISEDAYIAQGCEWGMFTKDQLADEPEIRNVLPALKIGDITPPIESDGGLAILRLDPSDNPENITFSRIFFRLPMFWETETPEEAAREIVQEKNRQLVNDTIKAFIGKMKIEYPNGPNIFLKDGKPIGITAAEFKAIAK